MQTIEMAKLQVNLVTAKAVANAIKVQSLAEVVIANAISPWPELKRTYKSRGNKL